MEIINCKKCSLYKNQLPLLDKIIEADVMFIGLSAKMIKNDINTPLHPSTNTGKIIKEIELKLKDYKVYKTNLVKCPPLDCNNKLRYPNKLEIDSCLNNLFKEIKLITPKIVFLLGEKVHKNVLSKIYSSSYEKYTPIKINNIIYLAIDHPSYVYVYKRKFMEEYINNIIKECLKIIKHK